MESAICESTDNGTTWSTAIELPSVAALALKAPLASPTFTGDVIVPDQTAGNNSTKAANTKYVMLGAQTLMLALKADVTDVTSALALKADITLLNFKKKPLLTAEIDAIKKDSIENSNAPYLTVSDYGDVTRRKIAWVWGTVGR